MVWVVNQGQRGCDPGIHGFLLYVMKIVSVVGQWEILFPCVSVCLKGHVQTVIWVYKRYYDIRFLQNWYVRLLPHCYIGCTF